MKRCIKCKELKSLIEFGKDSSRKDGLNRYCKECRSAERKEWYQHNKERRKEWYLAHIENIKKSREKNKERDKATRKKWYENKKQKVAEYNRAYYARNKAKINETTAKELQRNEY